MNEIRESRPYWWLIALAPLIPALLGAGSAYVHSRLGEGRADWNEVAFAFVDWLFLCALVPMIYILARRYPIKRTKIGRLLAVHSAGALTLCIVWASLGVLLGRFLNRFTVEQGVLVGLLSWMTISLPWSIFLYVLLLGSVYAFMYYREAREREAQQARLTAQLAEARLGALRMQLNPHFLFNSLNAITVLVRDHKTRDASRMLELLSEVLRQVLQTENRHEVTLDKELQFIEQYLEIEQVRFSDRLQVQWSIEPAVRDVLVPEFILQPLVENAIRHGVARITELGLIEITARAEDDQLVLSVRDNGPGYHPTMAVGVGLANTRARLETLFGKAAQLQVLNAEGGGTIAIVHLPLRRRSDG